MCFSRTSTAAKYRASKATEQPMTRSDFDAISRVCALASRNPCLASSAYAPIRFLLAAHAWVYSVLKRRDLEQRLAALGWRLERHGARHDLWRRAERTEAVPRHAEINDWLARAILARAQLKD